MGRDWKPSIADQLEDVANSLLDVAYAVAAIAEQLRAKRDSVLKRRPASAGDTPKRRKRLADGLGLILSALTSAPHCLT
jgi:hypothetical protein